MTPNPIDPFRLELETFELPNGLRVALHVDPSAPLVAVNLWYHVGSKNERPGRTGFAHLFEHLLFQGSEHVGTNQHFELVQRHGGVANGSTWYDRTNYYETLPSNTLDIGLWLESDRLGFFEKAITQEKLDNQRDVVKNERRSRYDNQPYGTWLERLTEVAYPAGHPYRSSVIGSMDDLDAATLDDVREFFRTWYAPNNAVLTVAGDIDPTEAREKIGTWFGEIPAVRLPPRPVATVPPADGEKRIVVEDQVRLPKLFRLWHSPGMREKGFHASDLVATMLAVGRSSRLHAALVRDRSLARDVSAFILPLELCGQLHVQATCREGVAPEQLEKAIDEEIARFVAVGPDEDELDRAKTRLETDLARQLDSLGDRADRFSEFHTLHGDPRLVAGEFGRIAAVTTGEIRELAARILVPANRATAWYLPRNGTANPGAD